LLQAGQQLGFLGVEFGVGQDVPAAQVGELVDHGEDVHGARVAGASGLRWRCGRYLRRCGRGCGRRLTGCRRLRNAIDRHDRQALDVDQAVLAVEAERAAIRLLLRKAADLVVQRVVDRDPAIHLDRKTPRLGEVRIAHAILGAGAVGPAQAGSPPVGRIARRGRDEQAGAVRGRFIPRSIVRATGVAVLLLATLALRLEAAAPEQVRLRCHQLRQFRAQVVDAGFQVVVEHVRHHGHATAHPLAGTGEFPVVELGHPAVAVDDRLQHAEDGVGAEAVAPGDVVDDLLAGWG